VGLAGLAVPIGIAPEAGHPLEHHLMNQLGMQLISDSWCAEVKDTAMPRNGPPVRFRRTWCH
jgi:hypothetical protein